MAYRIDKFEKLAGWQGHGNHILIYLNFLALLAEKHGYKQINKSIIKILDYFERAGNHPDNCFDLGMNAFKIWEGMV